MFSLLTNPFDRGSTNYARGLENTSVMQKHGRKLACFVWPDFVFKTGKHNEGHKRSFFSLYCWSKRRRVTVCLLFSCKSVPKQNARSLLTPVSDPAFHALSHFSFVSSLHGSFFNHFLIGQNSSTANQNL